MTYCSAIALSAIGALGQDVRLVEVVGLVRPGSAQVTRPYHKYVSVNNPIYSVEDEGYKVLTV